MEINIIEVYMRAGIAFGVFNLFCLLFGFYIGKLGPLSVAGTREQVDEISRMLCVSLNTALALSVVTQLVIDVVAWPRSLYLMIKRSSLKVTAKKL